MAIAVDLAAIATNATAIATNATAIAADLAAIAVACISQHISRYLLKTQHNLKS